MLTWSPSFSIIDGFYLVPELGGTILNSPTQRFFVFIFNFKGRLQLSHSWEVDLGVGSQEWTSGEGGLIFSAGSGLSYKLEQPIFNILTSIRAGFESIWLQGSQTYQFLLGVNWNFGG